MKVEEEMSQEDCNWCWYILDERKRNFLILQNILMAGKRTVMKHPVKHRMTNKRTLEFLSSRPFRSHTLLHLQTDCHWISGHPQSIPFGVQLFFCIWGQQVSYFPQCIESGQNEVSLDHLTAFKNLFKATCFRGSMFFVRACVLQQLPKSHFTWFIIICQLPVRDPQSNKPERTLNVWWLRLMRLSSCHCSCSLMEVVNMAHSDSVQTKQLYLINLDCSLSMFTII